MKQVPSNSSINDKGGSNPANIIFKKILDLHRKSHHFSIKKTAPTTITNIEEKIQSVSKKSLEEAFVAYKAAGEKAGKMPHPNYFLKVVQRLESELDKSTNKEYINGHTNLGKSI